MVVGDVANVVGLEGVGDGGPVVVGLKRKTSEVLDVECLEQF